MEIINWNALTPSQKDAEVHEKVMGHARRFATHTNGTRAGDAFNYNVISWQTGGPDMPRYSQSMDDAWLVVERVTRPPQSREEALHFNATQFMFWWKQAELWACSSTEAANEICMAALRALGYELTEETGQ